MLKNSNNKEVLGGHQVFYDRRKGFWRCKFAPDQRGVFEAVIMAKNKSDTNNFLPAVSFKIEALNIVKPSLSFPYTWQLFHDLNLKVEALLHQATITWLENASYVEILVRAPNDVQLSGN